jgi:glycerol-3-phosphate dehydrogenase
LEALGVPVLRCGARLAPGTDTDRQTIQGLAENAARNGVDVSVSESDGALVVPGEAVTDPVAFTLAMAGSAQQAGAAIVLDAKLVAISEGSQDLTLTLADGRRLRAEMVVNAAGLHADDVARLVGDASFEIYPRKGEFFVFELPDGKRLDHILLPVPTKRTKGVLVFPTLDGRVVAGPTAIDLTDKDDWSVRPEAAQEVLPKAAAQFPALRGLVPVATYAGLRPAGRDVNYVIGPSPACARLINVAAIRSTGLSASLGIADHVADLLVEAGVAVGEQRPFTAVEPRRADDLWWRRTARQRGTS